MSRSNSIGAGWHAWRRPRAAGCGGATGRGGWHWLVALMALWCGLSFGAAPAAAQDWVSLRRRMVAEIQDDVQATSTFIGMSHLRADIMTVMGEVPRHLYVPPEVRDQAYENRPLPIGYGQTISQPYIVALMTALIDPAPGDVVLEVGTGSGYQAAVLAALGTRVYTIEIIPELAQRAAALLRDVAPELVVARQGDGYFGWPEAGPFDAIVVTAAADHVPPPLVRQLKNGGRMVIPVGNRFSVQQLLLIGKDDTGRLTTRQVLPVRFVPLTGGARGN